MAFQRIRERIRRSMNRSPGIRDSWVTGMVLRKGVVMEYGSSVPSRLARSDRRSRMYLARSTPSFSIRDSSASSHSLVSMGSSSWYIKPSPWHQKVQRRPRSAATDGAKSISCDGMQYFLWNRQLVRKAELRDWPLLSIEQLSHFSCRATG